MAMSSLDIDTTKLKKSYSLKGKNKINIEGDFYPEDISVSGSTLTIYLNDEKKFKLTNISNPKGIKFNDEEYTLQDFYNDNFNNQWLPDDTEKWDKFTKVTGTVFDDYIDVSDFEIEKEKGLTVNAGAGDDMITGTYYDDKINGGAGNDTITGSEGNDKLTGGKGNNTFIFNYGDGADTITDADINDIIEISDTDSETLRYAKNKNNLEIFYNDEYDITNKIVIKNYFKTKSAKRLEKLFASDESEEDYTALSEKINNNLAITGSGQINGTNNSEIIIGSTKSDTIRAKGGDDVIYAGWGNDKITGGKGINTYVFNDVEVDDDRHGFGKDTVILTSEENAILDFSSLGLDEDELEFSFSKNNLVIKTEEYGQVTISNFKKSDTTGIKGSVLLKLSDDEEGIIDLKTKLFNVETTKDYKGAWYSEEIDAKGATKGLKITGGKGNDVITVNDIGGNTFVFNLGDGEDRINNATSTDVLQFETGNLNFTYQKIEDDLTVHYGETDSVTISEYFAQESPIDTIKVKNGKTYDVISIKETAIIDVVVTENYEKTSTFRENLIISKELEDDIEISGLTSTDKITFVDVPEEDEGDDDLDDLSEPNSIEPFMLTFSREDDGGLIINEKINVVDFFTNGADFDINYDETTINTANITVNVALNDFDYTATRYVEIFSGTGSVTGLSIDTELHDALNMVTEELHYDRVAGSDDVTISDGENGNELVVVDFFKNGDVEFVDGTSTKDAIIVVNLNDQTYTPTDYTEVFTGSGTVESIGDKDVFMFGEDDDVQYTLTDKGLEISGQEDIIFVPNYNFEGTLTVYCGDYDDPDNKDQLEDKTLYVSGFEQFEAENYPFRCYDITGTDKEDNLTGGAYDDVIRGAEGDDSINAGAGENDICYSLGDGDDIISSGGGTDTLVFDEGITVTAEYSGDDVLVTYSGTKDGNNYENTISLSDFSGGHSVQYIKIGEDDSVSIDEYLNGGGEDDPHEIHIKEDDAAQTYTLKKGDNYVIFDDAPLLGKGHVLQSENTVGNGYTDTLDLSGENEQGKGLAFMDNTLLIYGLSKNDIYTDDLWLDATAFPDYPGGNEIIYKDFYSDNAPNVVITDNERSYVAIGYNTAQNNMQLDDDDVDRLIAIKADSNWNNIVSNKNNNVIYSFGGASLSYEYGGGQDNVTSLEIDISDNYVVDYSSDVSLNIIDWGGDNDGLSVTGANLSDMRILFDVRRPYYPDEVVSRSEHVIITKSDKISDEMLGISTLPKAVITDGINLDGEMETVTIGTNVNIENWCSQIQSNVVEWLTDNGYDSVYDVFYGENPYQGDDIDTLVGYYDVQYSGN